MLTLKIWEYGKLHLANVYATARICRPLVKEHIYCGDSKSIVNNIVMLDMIRAERSGMNN
jgi:hypothetical protein